MAHVKRQKLTKSVLKGAIVDVLDQKFKTIISMMFKELKKNYENNVCAMGKYQ